MKRIIPALFVALLAGSAAQAQSINLGPGGVTVDPRGPRERAIDRDIRREERMRERDRYERRRDYRADRGRGNCRTVTVREETPRGVIRRQTRECD